MAIRRWKESSQEVYLRLFRDHLLPFFGDLPLGAIDEDVLSRFDGRIMKYKPNFRNLLLARVKKVFGHALKLRYVDRAPLIERHKTPAGVLGELVDQRFLDLILDFPGRSGV